MVMIQPTPTKPSVPTLRGPSSHSPLPMEIPRAIRLGPRRNFTTSLRPGGGAGDAQNLLGLGQVDEGERLADPDRMGCGLAGRWGRGAVHATPPAATRPRA